MSELMVPRSHRPSRTAILGKRKGAPVKALRCIEAMPYYDSGKKSAEVIHRGPAMLAAFTRGGKFSGLHITWLTGEELACMHETEQPGINYHFARLKGLDRAAIAQALVGA